MIHFFGDGHLGRSTWRCCGDKKTAPSTTLPEAKSFAPMKIVALKDAISINWGV